MAATLRGRSGRSSFAARDNEVTSVPHTTKVPKGANGRGNVRKHRDRGGRWLANGVRELRLTLLRCAPAAAELESSPGLLTRRLLNLYASLTPTFSPIALPPLPSVALVGHITWDGGSVDFQFNVFRLFSSNARRRRAAFHPPCQVHAAGKLRGRGAGTSLAAPVQATSMDTSRAKSVASGQPTHTANMALHSWTAPKG